MKKHLIEFFMFLMAGILYSLMAFAYMHNTFPSKDIFQLVVEKLTSIELKIDKLHLGGK